MGKEKFTQALKALQQRKWVTSLGTVTKVTGNSCHVKRHNLPDLTDVRLQALVADVSNFVYVNPAINSKVICLEIEGAPEETCIVKYSEVNQIQVVIDGFEIELSEGKLKLANETDNLKEILKGLLKELKQAVIQTPSGPGSFSPENILAFSNLEQNTENLLK